MKKMMTAIFVLLLFSLISCAAPSAEEAASLRPYELSEEDISLLNAVGAIRDSYGIFSFTAPDGTLRIQCNIYELNEDEQWQLMHSVTPSLSHEGIFSVVHRDDLSAFIHFEADSITSYIAPPEYTAESCAFFISFLDEEKEPVLNEEIPVALIMYDSQTIPFEPTLEDYPNTEAFASIDSAKVVTLVFSDLE